MNDDSIPADVRRFLQSNALSIPHIETILLLRREPAMAWTDGDVARRLYVTEGMAEQLLHRVEAMGIVDRVDELTRSYYYRPRTPELASLLDRLDAVYAKHLLAVTKLVHAARDETAEQFARAFQFRKDD